MFEPQLPIYKRVEHDLPYPLLHGEERNGQACSALPWLDSMPHYEYRTADGKIDTIYADGYKTDGDQVVFWEKYRDPTTGATEREVLRVRADSRDVVRINMEPGPS